MAGQEIIVTELPDSGRILDQDINEWVNGWQTFFRVTKTVVFHDKVNLNITNEVFSQPFRCAKYRQVGVAFNLATPVVGGDTILIYIQFSDDGVTYYTLNTDPPPFYDTVATSLIYPSLANSDPSAGIIEVPAGGIAVPQVFVRPVVGEYCRIGVIPNTPLASDYITIKGFFSS